MTRKITVTRKARPHPIPANLKWVLSIRILREYFGDALRSSDAMRIIIVVTASHKLISESVKGKFIFNHSSTIFKVAVVILPSGEVIIFCMVMGLPTYFETAQAAALTIGHPNRVILWRLYCWL